MPPQLDAKVVDDRILLTFYNVWRDTLHNWVGWGKVRGEYFLHCVTIWQISQLGSSQRGNLENAQVSPISKLAKEDTDLC